MKPRPPIRNVNPPDRSRESVYPSTSHVGRTWWYLRQNWTEFGPFPSRRLACAYARVPFWWREFNPTGLREYNPALDLDRERRMAGRVESTEVT